MLLTKTVKIKWRNNNKNWYVNKGYIFTKTNDMFEVSTKDLPQNSGQKVKYLCDYCLKENNHLYRN